MTNQYQPLVDAMEQGVRDILNQLIDGTIEELDGPIRECSLRLTMASRKNRPDLVEACRDQLELIVLEKRLRLEGQGDGVFGTILNVGLNALVNGAIGALASKRL
jgi:hypothetical protein